MIFTDLDTRTTDDDNSEADINQLMENIMLNRYAEYIAAATINQYQVATADGLLANSATAAHGEKILGVAHENVVALDPGLAQYSAEIVNGAWTWTPGGMIFLNGTSLSQTAPVTGFRIQIGVAITATKMLVRIGDPVYLP